jgi:hypothetical protein
MWTLLFLQIIQGKNSAAAGLCNFVINIVGYYDIVVTVEPKRQALREANEQLSSANARLATVLQKVCTQKHHERIQRREARPPSRLGQYAV